MWKYDETKKFYKIINGKKRGIFVKATCVCGVTKDTDIYSIRSGDSTSCGCANRLLKKGRSKEYKAWISMKARCLNKKDCNWKRYGARGITFSKEWSTFNQFYLDMGDCPIGYSLDRIDNDGNYEASNCRWADNKTQSNNTRTNVYITLYGKTKTRTQWCRKYNINVTTYDQRIKRGWDIEKALTYPVQKHIRN